MVYGTSRRQGRALLTSPRKSQVNYPFSKFNIIAEKFGWFHNPPPETQICRKSGWFQNIPPETQLFFLICGKMWSGTFMRPSGAPTPPNLRVVNKNRNVSRVGEVSVRRPRRWIGCTLEFSSVFRWINGKILLFAEKSGKFAGKSGMKTPTYPNVSATSG